MGFNGPETREAFELDILTPFKCVSNFRAPQSFELWLWCYIFAWMPAYSLLSSITQ